MSTKEEKKRFWKKLNIPKRAKKLAKKITLGVALLFASNTASANPIGGTSSNGPNDVKTGINVKAINSNAFSASMLSNKDSILSSIKVYNDSLLYNDENNGSPFHMTSQLETFEAGMGKKAPSVAMINSSNHRGIFQMSNHHTRNYAKFLNNCDKMSLDEFIKDFHLKGQYTEEQCTVIKETFGKIGKELTSGGATNNSNFKKVMLKYGQMSYLSQQWFGASEYMSRFAPTIQQQLNDSNINFNIQKLHPVLIGCIIRKTVLAETAAKKQGIALAKYLTKHPDVVEQLNAGEAPDDVIEALAGKKSALAKIAKHDRDSVSFETWEKNKHEFAMLYKKMDTNETWFDIQLDMIKQAKAKENLERANKEIEKEMREGICQSAFSLDVNQNFAQLEELAQIKQKAQANLEDQKITHLKPNKDMKTKGPFSRMIANAKNNAHRKNLTLAEVKKADERARAALGRKKAITRALQPQEPQIDSNPPTAEEEVIAMIQKDLSAKKSPNSRKAKQARRNWERFNNDESYRNAVIQAYKDGLSQQNKA